MDLGDQFAASLAGQQAGYAYAPKNDSQVHLAKWVIEVQHQSVWPEATLKLAVAIITKALA